MTSMTFAVDGVHCGSCATKISTALDGLDNVTGVHVDVQSGQVTVAAATAGVEDDIVATITDLGYTAVRS